VSGSFEAQYQDSISEAGSSCSLPVEAVRAAKHSDTAINLPMSNVVGVMDQLWVASRGIATNGAPGNNNIAQCHRLAMGGASWYRTQQTKRAGSCYRPPATNYKKHRHSKQCEEQCHGSAGALLTRGRQEWCPWTSCGWLIQTWMAHLSKFRVASPWLVAAAVQSADPARMQGVTAPRATQWMSCSSRLVLLCQLWVAGEKQRQAQQSYARQHEQCRQYCPGTAC
jgi:hypothetical protein